MAMPLHLCAVSSLAEDKEPRCRGRAAERPSRADGPPLSPGEELTLVLQPQGLEVAFRARATQLLPGPMFAGGPLSFRCKSFLQVLTPA